MEAREGEVTAQTGSETLRQHWTLCFHGAGEEVLVPSIFCFEAFWQDPSILLLLIPRSPCAPNFITTPKTELVRFYLGNLKLAWSIICRCTCEAGLPGNEFKVNIPWQHSVPHKSESAGSSGKKGSRSLSKTGFWKPVKQMIRWQRGPWNKSTSAKIFLKL